jgi:hypothetical protein
VSEDFRLVLERRFAERRPRKLVRAATRLLGWVARHLPRGKRTRAAVDRALGPAAAWSIAQMPMFDFASPADEKYWQRVEGMSPFLRAVYAWLGVESAAMHYGKNFRLAVIQDDHCVERLYLRDESGAEHAGCPWGLRRAGDGFACRTIMIGSRHVFDKQPAARMKIDIGIPEMLSLEAAIGAELQKTPGAVEEELWAAIEPVAIELFKASNPEEDDFFVDGKLREATAVVIRDLIAAIKAGKKPALFCQFRLLATAR